MGFLDRMKDRAEDLAEKAKPKVDELREKAQPKAEELREKAKPLAEKAKDRAGKMAASAKESAQGFREELGSGKNTSGGTVTDATPPPPGPAKDPGTTG